MSDAMINAPAEAAHGHEADIEKHIRVYMFVFGALAVLTVVTVAVAFLDMPIWPALIVALIIASVKGGLVAGYFMHLVSEKKVVHWVLILTVPLLLVMFALFLFAYYDQEGGFPGL